MKKLLLAASVLALAAMGPAMTRPVQAASAKNPYCNLAKGQKNLVSWNAYYHCLGAAPQATRTSAQARPAVREAPPPGYAYGRPTFRPARREEARNPYCNLAKGQKNLVSWNAYYGCLNR
jgi:hypothetical protein